jgi:hypothetical protein
MSPSGVYDRTGTAAYNEDDEDEYEDQLNRNNTFRAQYDSRGQNHQGGGGYSSDSDRMTAGYYGDGSAGGGDEDGRYGTGGAASSSSTGGQQWAAGDSRDDMVASFSDDDAEEIDSRSRYSSAMNARYGGDQQTRSKSLMRYSEIERERSRRRQHIVKQKAVKKFSPGTIKLSMMNAGIIPLKKGKLSFA